MVWCLLSQKGRTLKIVTMMSVMWVTIGTGLNTRCFLERQWPIYSKVGEKYIPVKLKMHQNVPPTPSQVIIHFIAPIDSWSNYLPPIPKYNRTWLVYLQPCNSSLPLRTCVSRLQPWFHKASFRHQSIFSSSLQLKNTTKLIKILKFDTQMSNWNNTGNPITHAFESQWSTYNA